ncbi:MAG: DUF2959 family protein [Planctomycetota bacterium]
MQQVRPLLVTFLVAALTCGCQSTSSSTFQAGDGEERKLELVHLVQDVQDSQVEAQIEFSEAFALFRRLTQLEDPPEELEVVYDDLIEELEDCEVAALDLHEQVETVASQAAMLFTSWSDELTAFSSPTLRGKSEAMLRENQKRFEALLVELQRTEAQVVPLLTEYRDYVLFFNHNLNPRAIATIQDTLPAFLETSDAVEEAMKADAALSERFVQFVLGRGEWDAEPEGREIGAGVEPPNEVGGQ